VILPTASLLLIFAADAGGADAGPAKLVAAPEDVLARVDALHRRRDEKAVFAEERRLLDAALARAPTRYEVLWRAARASFWESDDPGASREERSRAGKVGWDLAERAIVANGARPEGHYFAAVNMGSYALGLGLVKALTLGLEGKFKERLGRAGQLAPGFEFGAIDVVWGRFYELLPWPKRDRNEAEKHFRRVLTLLNPANLRARVFLAETLAAEDRAPEARAILEQVAAARPGAYDAPEERRAKALGAALMPAVIKAAR
jgi:tetratricopeptide (TPR) repeat protein